MAHATYRLAEARDARALQGLAEAFARESGAQLGATGEQLAEHYCAGPVGLHPTIIACLGGAAQGFLAMRGDEIKALYVSPSVRVRGIAIGMLSAVSASMPAAQRAYSDDVASGFYSAIGWRQKRTWLGIVERTEPLPFEPTEPVQGRMSLELEDGALSLDWTSSADPRPELNSAGAAAFATLHPPLTGDPPLGLWKSWGAQLRQIILNVAP